MEATKGYHGHKENLVHQRVIRKQYSDVIHDGKEIIDEYINQLKEFQRALNGTMDPISDDALVNKIITTLPAEWDLKLRIIEDVPDLTLVKLEKVLRSYQITLNARKVQDIALTTKGRNGRKRGKSLPTKRCQAAGLRRIGMT